MPGGLKFYSNTYYYLLVIHVNIYISYLYCDNLLMVLCFVFILPVYMYIFLLLYNMYMDYI